jgi:uncharacterized membrane protein YphA (DoxX/SURF4 family)
MKKNAIVEIITVLYIILFLYSGISKIMEYSIFKEQIATSPFFAPFSKLIAVSVPALEFISVALLIIPAWRLKGLYTSLALMTIFTLYIIGIMMLNDKLPCSCGGVISELSWTQHIIFNCIFIALATIGAIFQIKVKREFRSELTTLSQYA